MGVGIHGACTLPGRLDALAYARTWAVALGEEAGLTAQELSDLALLLTEAVSNIVRHGYGGDDRGEVELDFDADAERVQLVIRDRAGWWDGVLGERTQHGGYGLTLIHDLADVIDRRQRDGGGTELRLVVHRNAST